jgi:excinuclease ABC subunit A
VLTVNRQHGVVIEHNLDVIKSADHVIDLGPERGTRAVDRRLRHAGGYRGPAGSYTGPYLKQALSR